MNILIIHEIDWFKKVVFEPHHFAELFSLKGHNVFVVDCPDADTSNVGKGAHTQVIQNYHRVYDDASITVIRPSALLIKGLNRLTHFFSCKKIIKNIILEKKIDIILLYGSATNGKQTIQLAKEFGIPVIFRVLDVAHGFVKIPMARQLAQKHEKYVISQAQLVLTTTPHLARYANEMGAEQKLVEPFSLGINMRDFKPLEKDLGLANTMNIQEGDAVIAFIGTLFPFSGLDNIVSNFEVIQKTAPKTKFLIIGGGPAFSRLAALVKSKKLESSVMLLGFKNQKDLPRYLALADICVNPFEINYITRRILPTKILEYLSCGKPVLSTPLEGTKELLPDESYGIIYAQSTEFVKSLADLVTKKEKLVELGKNGYSYVQKNHNWDVLCDKLLAKFQDLIAKNSHKQ